MPTPLEVPELVCQRARANGLAGQQWLDGLPDVVAALVDRWGLELGASFGGGTASFVAAATDQSGRACVLKVAMPAEIDGVDAFSRSVLVHQLAGSRGCAELFEHDESIPAMLLERLGPNLDDLRMELPQLLETIAATLRAFWSPVAADCDLPTGPEKARRLASYITTSWDQLSQPCGREVIDRALAYCDERSSAFDPSQAVLVHGDAHGWNTLGAGLVPTGASLSRWPREVRRLRSPKCLGKGPHPALGGRHEHPSSDDAVDRRDGVPQRQKHGDGGWRQERRWAKRLSSVGATTRG